MRRNRIFKEGDECWMPGGFRGVISKVWEAGGYTVKSDETGASLLYTGEELFRSEKMARKKDKRGRQL